MLPIAHCRDSIVDSVRRFKTTIVVGETGSGKSTQLPQFLVELLSPKGKLVCTQPRRVATISVAQRVAQERNCTIGEEVGYSIRFEDKYTRKTRIKFVTDGVLLRECMGDKDLQQYDIVILDEAHERSLQTDILMGLLRQLQEVRPSLRIVVMSATLQIDLFMSYFLDTNLITIAGRQFPVQVLYATEAVDDYVDAAMLTCMQIHAEEEDGGVLVFLPGQDDIESLQSMLEDQLPFVKRTKTLSTDSEDGAQVVEEVSGIPSDGLAPEIVTTFQTEIKATKAKVDNSDSVFQDPAKSLDRKKQIVCSKGQPFVIYPLYAGMTPEDQMAAFRVPKPGTRKFILATNIAETSVTIAGIKFVVDCGFVKSRMLTSVTGVEMLKVVPVSKAQANQRAGRSGRECPGKCFRLYTESAFEGLDTMSIPEIQRVGMAQVVLQLKLIGIKDPLAFPYLSPPTREGLVKAMSLLVLLGALEKADMSLTTHGRNMAALPLEPQYAHWLLKSKEFGCTSEVLTSVSLLSTDNLMLHPHREAEKKAADIAHRRFSSRDGDIPALNNIYAAWLQANKDSIWTSRNYLSQRGLVHATSIRQQLSHLVSRLSLDPTLSCGIDKESFLRCLTVGMCHNSARLVQTNSNAISASSSSTGGMHQSLTVASKGSKSMVRNSNAAASGLAIGVIEAPYVTMRGNQPVHIHPSSVLFSGTHSRNLPPYVIFAELLVTSKQYMRGVTAIDGSWLTSVPGFGRRAESNPIVTTPTIPSTSRIQTSAASVEKFKFEPNATSFSDSDHLPKKRKL